MEGRRDATITCMKRRWNSHSFLLSLASNRGAHTTRKNGLIQPSRSEGNSMCTNKSKLSLPLVISFMLLSGCGNDQTKDSVPTEQFGSPAQPVQMQPLQPGQPAQKPEKSMSTVPA